ncbi:type VI secretion system tube protein TssD [Pantoea sp. MBD-2R]|uniref:type VI secretion system tube protein TssD n=1 Tax=Pantoea sp. MBD-2R TaxID=3141540 RepID=UPI003182DC17
MAIPVYLFLKDDGGSVIKGSVDIAGRENSIEVLGLHHLISFPTNDSSGRANGARQHIAYMIEKEIDSSSAYLYKALATGKKLKSAELRFYRINYSGQEEEYFNVVLENPRVVNIMPVMLDIKDISKERFNHMEIVEFRYEKITWHYLDGHIIHADSWACRPGALM